MTHTLLLSSLLLLAPEDTDPAERLVRAEVLEVAKGDLEKAMVEYRAIEADEKAPASVRARALLALGRCQRKRGELEAARRTFADVLARHPEEKETGRRAKSFLEEIEKGRPENPDFDWLGDLEKNPEIQARVFELAMQSAGPEDLNEVRPAIRQLLALGRAALPVLDKVIEVSGDRRHRRTLATIELHAGRWDRLALALDGGALHSWVLRSFLESVIPGLPEENRRALLAELDKTAALASTDLGHFVRLWAGDVSRIGEAIPALQRHGLENGLAERIADAGPSGVQALAAMVLDPQTKESHANTCFKAIRERRPEALTDELWIAQVERGAKLYHDMEREGKFEALEKLARSTQADKVVNSFWDSRRINVDGRIMLNPQVLKDHRATDPRWARILRTAKAGTYLKWLAEARDDAVPEFVGYLREREFDHEDPKVREHRRMEAARDNPDLAWTPSDIYLRSMVPLLEHTDPEVVRIALAALFRAEVKRIEDVVPRIEKLALESPEESVRLRAFAALLTLFAGDPEKTRKTALLWIAEAERGESRTPSTARGRPPGQRPVKDRVDRVVAEVLQTMSKSLLYPPVLAAANERGASRFHDAYCQTTTGVNELPLLIERLDEVTHPDLMGSALQQIVSGTNGSRLDESTYEADSRARILYFLERVAKDRRAALDVRAGACWMARSFFSWFDWPALLRSDDPLAAFLIDSSAHPVLRPDTPRNLLLDGEVWQAIGPLPDGERISIYKAMLESPVANVRINGIQRFPLDHASAAEVLRAGLSDSSESVRGMAIKVLSGFTRADAAPAFAGLLGHEDKRVRVAVLDALTRFADPASIEPMVALLDDPDVEVRSKALEGVKDIRRVLEEKEVWKEWVRRLKAPQEAEKVKSAPPERPAKK